MRFIVTEKQTLERKALTTVIDHGYAVGPGPFDDNPAQYTLLKGSETVYLADVEQLIQFVELLQSLPITPSA